jgi:short-subunit dehydrogenase
MNIKLKKLKDQVVVITGASSGIGLTTAEMAGERGAKVVLAARSGAELDGAAARIRSRGGQATSITADVADEQQVEAIAQHAIDTYGRIDTWINDAGLGMYGRLVDQPIADKRKLFEAGRPADRRQA